MTKLTISPKIFTKFSKLNVGIVIAKNIDNTGSDQKIAKLLKEIEDYVKINFTPVELAKHPLISPWRAAYSDFGSKPVIDILLILISRYEIQNVQNHHYILIIPQVDILLIYHPIPLN